MARLVELELIDRERRMVEHRIKAAKFPVTKSLDSFDFTAIPSLNKMQVLELARCEWIDRCEKVIALGPSGTGKTQVSIARRVGCHREVDVELPRRRDRGSKCLRKPGRFGSKTLRDPKIVSRP